MLFPDINFGVFGSLYGGHAALLHDMIGWFAFDISRNATPSFDSTYACSIIVPSSGKELGIEEDSSLSALRAHYEATAFHHTFPFHVSKTPPAGASGSKHASQKRSSAANLAGTYRHGFWGDVVLTHHSNDDFVTFKLWAFEGTLAQGAADGNYDLTLSAEDEDAFRFFMLLFGAQTLPGVVAIDGDSLTLLNADVVPPVFHKVAHHNGVDWLEIELWMLAAALFMALICFAYYWVRVRKPSLNPYQQAMLKQTQTISLENNNDLGNVAVDNPMNANAYTALPETPPEF
jgi:hypothetical protein